MTISPARGMPGHPATTSVQAKRGQARMAQDRAVLPQKPGTATATGRAATAVRPSPLKAGRHDGSARRKAQRRGRETGCWVYIAGEALARAGYAPGDPAPHYRIWGGDRGRYIVTLYRTA